MKLREPKQEESGRGVDSVGLKNTLGLYLQKQPLAWDVGLYSSYLTFSSISGLLVSVAGIAVLKRALRLSDPAIAFIANLGLATMLIWQSLARHNWEFFAAEVIGGLQLAAGPCIKSFINQLVAPDEATPFFPPLLASST